MICTVSCDIGLICFSHEMISAESQMSRASVNRLRAVSIAETLTCEKGIVDLWYYYYEDTNAELVAAHEALLTPDECDRYKRFHFDRDRRLFLATRALVRTVLSGYSAVSPGEWRFAASEHGKPLISAPAVTPRIHFNLANTPGLVVCVVSVAHELLGVDAERIDREVEAVALAERYFSGSEVRKLRALPVDQQQGRFFAYWTLKESYIKARGLGLALPLDQFSFHVEDEISVEFDTRLADDATSWRFALLDAPHHTIAISVNTNRTALSLRATRVVPLSGVVEWPGVS
jgi:4'-phosphopantetheinyl transferase